MFLNAFYMCAGMFLNASFVNWRIVLTQLLELHNMHIAQACCHERDVNFAWLLVLCTVTHTWARAGYRSMAALSQTVRARDQLSWRGTQECSETCASREVPESFLEAFVRLPHHSSPACGAPDL
jgi:hypothetical protein